MHRFYAYHSFKDTSLSDDVKIRSHIEYLIQTHYILVLILYSKVLRNLALMTVFNTL